MKLYLADLTDFVAAGLIFAQMVRRQRQLAGVAVTTLLCWLSEVGHAKARSSSKEPAIDSRWPLLYVLGVQKGGKLSGEVSGRAST